jgi:hypothetical protein
MIGFPSHLLPPPADAIYPICAASLLHSIRSIIERVSAIADVCCI